MIDTHVDELVDYNQLICRKLKSSIPVMQLISNNPNIDLNEPSSAEWEDHIFDYAWVDDTVQEASAFITVDVDIPEISSGTIKEMRVYVQVLISQTYMQLPSDLFPGIKGNRRDNLVRQIDLLLNGSYEFGIGMLNLTSIRTVTAANKFSSKLLTYEVSDFNRNRKLLQ